MNRDRKINIEYQELRSYNNEELVNEFLKLEELLHLGFDIVCLLDKTSADTTTIRDKKHLKNFENQVRINSLMKDV